MKSMTELISPQAQKAFEAFMSNRVEIASFEGRDTRALTLANSAFFEQFSDLNGVEIQRIVEGNLRLEEIRVPEARDDKVIYFIHGGGFVTGEPAWGYFYAVEVAKRTRRRMVAVDYRLAPEFPFPSGVEDCIEGYRWLLNNGAKAENIVMLGESSGGNLILAVCVACKQRGLPLPAALCPISPVVDVTFPFPSYVERNERECVLPKNQAEDVRLHYLKKRRRRKCSGLALSSGCKRLPADLSYRCHRRDAV